MHTMIIELQLLSHLNNALKGLLLKGLMFESETNGFVDDLILSQYSFSFTHTLIFSIRKVVTTNDIQFFSAIQSSWHLRQLLVYTKIGQLMMFMKRGEGR